MTKKPIIILPQWAEYQIKLKSKIEKQRLKLRKLAGIIRLKNKTIERLEEKAKICDYWKEEYAEEKKVRNEAIMGNILKMNKIIAIRNALTEEYWGPRGVPAWDKKEFTSYDYDDGDAKNTVDRIARILGAED